MEYEQSAMDTLSFAPSSALDVDVKIRMCVRSAVRLLSIVAIIVPALMLGNRIDLEGDEAQWPASTLLANPALRHVGSNTRCARGEKGPRTIRINTKGKIGTADWLAALFQISSSQSKFTLARNHWPCLCRLHTGPFGMREGL
jgi:hypothetical protein